MNSNEGQLGLLNNYRKCTCQAYCGEEGKFIPIRRYNDHTRKRKRDELMLCKEAVNQFKPTERNPSIITQALNFHK